MKNFVRQHFNFLSSQQQGAWLKVLLAASQAQQAKIKKIVQTNPEIAHTIWEHFTLQLYLNTQNFPEAEKNVINQSLHAA